ncbi:MAG: hypothetical protein ACD_75C01660G0001 [uncultured bacterium]|nr:MAG: hypothetical protein ACD_75C01660G0001 [uncultured bacterium]
MPLGMLMENFFTSSGFLRVLMICFRVVLVWRLPAMFSKPISENSMAGRSPRNSPLLTGSARISARLRLKMRRSLRWYSFQVSSTVWLFL